MLAVKLASTSPDTPFWAIVLAIPFASKALITVPVHLMQQRKYESRLPSLAMAVYEVNKATHKERMKRKRGTADYAGDEHILDRKGIHKKYGYNVSTTQLLPYSAALVQLPIHLTMFVALRTMTQKYPLWTQGGPEVELPGLSLALSNLSLTDASLVLPLSIGCTMGVLQLMMYRRNQVREANIPQGALMYVNAAATLGIAYMALSWSIGFNLYIVANLSSYVVQTRLMDSDV